MAVLVLASPGGAPGVTTTALALALAWPRAVVMAECDPAGGSVLAGLWQRNVPPGAAGAMLRVAVAAQGDPHTAAASLFAAALPLERTPAARFVLPTGAGPEPGRQLAGSWPVLMDTFAAARHDIIADVGRYDGDPALAALLARADRVLIVCRPTIGQAAAAKPRLAGMAQHRPADGLLLIGTGPYGADAARLFTRDLGVRVTGELPWDAATARVLAGEADPDRRRFPRTPLMRAAGRIAARIAGELAAAAAGQPPVEARQ
jgi:hypothetical protein